jgi:hypothetical protein
MSFLGQDPIRMPWLSISTAVNSHSLRQRHSDANPIPGAGVILGIRIPEAHQEDWLNQGDLVCAVVKIVEALFINQKLLVHRFNEARTFALVYMAFFITFRDGNPARCKTSTSTNYPNMSIYNSII